MLGVRASLTYLDFFHGSWIKTNKQANELKKSEQPQNKLEHQKASKSALLCEYRDIIPLYSRRSYLT